MCGGGNPEGSTVGLIDVYLSLGSNLGDRRRTIENALVSLEERGVSIVRRSSLYETEPTDFQHQPWFLNLVVEATASLSSCGLLQTCKATESQLGRGPGPRFGPRVLDIDVLLYGRETIVEGDLVVPHPRMHRRRFVLVPLVEIAPDLTDPRDGRRFDDMLNGLDEGKQVVRLASTGF